jgi:outer membrane protein assembly factor BamB/S1-C subfamily serine protease/plastocyanin
MHVALRCFRGRSAPCLVMVMLAAVLPGLFKGVVSAQIDPRVRDRVAPAIVEVAIEIEATENGIFEARYLPVGSGTIVSSDGLILTNWHVVDMAAHRAQLDAWEAQATRDGASLAFVLHENRVLILTTDGSNAPTPTYTAEVVAEHHALDLAVLRITGDEYGAPLTATNMIPFVPLGDSSGVRQGDPIDLFGYPLIGGESLTYTDGVVSGFGYEEGIDGHVWITTNATMSGGSSGGAALDRAGRLIGVPTQGTELDCRPGDTNRDGMIDEEDVGCIPLGGSIGQLRPINLAKPLLLHAGWTPVHDDVAAALKTGATQPVTPTEVPADPTSVEEPQGVAVQEPGAREIATANPIVTLEAGSEAGPHQTGDVPMYRGNAARTGAMPGPEPRGQISELWRIETGTEVWSSPALVDGVLYVGTGGWMDTAGVVLALDAETGNELWRHPGGPFVASPAVVDGRLYIASLDGYLHVLDAETGRLIASRTPHPGLYCPSGSSPAVDDAIVLVSFGCFGPEDTADSVPWSDLSGVVVAYDRDGQERWRFAMSGYDPFVSPALLDGVVVIADSSNAQHTAGTVYAIDAESGQEFWRFRADTGFANTPAIGGGLAFIAGWSGDLFALDLKSGTERWRFKLGTLADHVPAIIDGSVYAAAYYGGLFALRADSGLQQWLVQCTLCPMSPPVVTASTVFFAGNGTIDRIDRIGGEVDLGSRIHLPDPHSAIIGSIVVSGGIIFVATENGAIIALGDVREQIPIEANMDVEVVGATSLHAAPSSGAVVRGEVQAGDRLRTTGFAEEREGQTWWPVEADGVGTGWVMESAIIAAEMPPSPTSTQAPPTNTPVPTSTPRPTSTPLPTETPSSQTGSPDVTILSIDIDFIPEEVTIPANTDVVIALPNEGVVVHNFSLDEKNNPNLPIEAIGVDIDPAATEQATINLPAGRYYFYCDIPGHEAAGMYGTLVVN